MGLGTRTVYTESSDFIFIFVCLQCSMEGNMGFFLSAFRCAVEKPDASLGQILPGSGTRLATYLGTARPLGPMKILTGSALAIITHLYISLKFDMG